MKTQVSATPHKAVMGYIAWNGWNMTNCVTPNGRKLALSAALHASICEDDALGMTRHAFEGAKDDATVASILKGSLEFSDAEGVVRCAKDATIETYHALCKAGSETDLRIESAWTAAEDARERGEVHLCQELAATHHALSTLRRDLTVLLVVAGGLWHLQSQEG